MNFRAFRSLFAAWLVSAVVLIPAKAMSVLPPSFEELVDESSQITKGEVISTEAIRATTSNGTQVIKTRVTWAVQAALKGGTPQTLTLDFLGGHLGNETLDVPGMPRFNVGDKGYVFVGSNTKALCPIIAGGHGHIRILEDAATGTTIVARHDGTPLHALSELKGPLEEHATAEGPLPNRNGALTAADFEAAIRTRVLVSTTK